MTSQTSKIQPGVIFLYTPGGGAVQVAGVDFKADESHSLFDERAGKDIDEGMARSMKAQWLLEKTRMGDRAAANSTPVKVRYKVDEEGKETDLFEIVDGRGRDATGRFLLTNDPQCEGLKLRAFIDEAANSDDLAATESVHTSNAHVDDDAMTAALKTKRLVLTYDHEQAAANNRAPQVTEAGIQQAAVVLMVTDNTIRNRIKLVDLVPPENQKLVAAGKLGPSLAVELLKRTPEEQVALVAEAAEKGLSREALKRRTVTAPAAGGGATGDGDTKSAAKPLSPREIEDVYGLMLEDGKNCKVGAAVKATLHALLNPDHPEAAKELVAYFTRVRDGGEKPGARARAEEEKQAAEKKAKAEANAKAAEEAAKKAKEEATKAEAAAKEAAKAAKGTKGKGASKKANGK